MINTDFLGVLGSSAKSTDSLWFSVKSVVSESFCLLVCKRQYLSKQILPGAKQELLGNQESKMLKPTRLPPNNVGFLDIAG